jgi:hypothetical protein
MMGVEQSVKWLAEEIEVLGKYLTQYHFVCHKYCTNGLESYPGRLIYSTSLSMDLVNNKWLLLSLKCYITSMTDCCKGLATTSQVWFFSALTPFSSQYSSHRHFSSPSLFLSRCYDHVHIYGSVFLTLIS